MTHSSDEAVEEGLDSRLDSALINASQSDDAYAEDTRYAYAGDTRYAYSAVVGDFGLATRIPTQESKRKKKLSIVGESTVNL